MSSGIQRMRELLPRAKAMKSVRIEELRKTISTLEQQAEILRSRIVDTERMVPADFFEILEVLDREDSEKQLEAAEKLRLLDSRQHALDEAYLRGRGILPPEVANIKSLYFGMFGSVFGIATGAALTLALGGTSSQLLFITALVVGAMVGCVLGFYIFHISFTVDHSLEYSEKWLHQNRFSIVRQTLVVPKS